MAQIITFDDLPSAVTADVDIALLSLWVNGANATASRVAPCLVSDDPVPTSDQIAEAKLVLVNAVSRWADTGIGAITQESAGPFSRSIDTSHTGGYKLWPSEIDRLQDICAQGGSSPAFSVDTAPISSVHADWCDLVFGATTCSCGASIAGFPIYEQA